MFLPSGSDQHLIKTGTKSAPAPFFHNWTKEWACCASTQQSQGQSEYLALWHIQCHGQKNTIIQKNIEMLFNPSMECFKFYTCWTFRKQRDGEPRNLPVSSSTYLPVFSSTTTLEAVQTSWGGSLVLSAMQLSWEGVAPSGSPWNMGPSLCASCGPLLGGEWCNAIPNWKEKGRFKLQIQCRSPSVPLVFITNYKSMNYSFFRVRIHKR